MRVRLWEGGRGVRQREASGSGGRSQTGRIYYARETEYRRFFLIFFFACRRTSDTKSSFSKEKERCDAAKYAEVKCKPIVIRLDTCDVKCSSEKTDTFYPSTQTHPLKPHAPTHIHKRSSFQKYKHKSCCSSPQICTWRRK